MTHPLTSLAPLLCCGFAGFALVALARQRTTARQLDRIGEIVKALQTGKRPATFILHGGKPVREIALNLERLADRRDAMEAQIAREEFNLKALLASMVEGVMVVNTQHQILMVNASFVRLFDFANAPQVLGRSVLHVLRNAAAEEVIGNALETGEAVSRSITISLSQRHLAMNAAPVRDAQGTIFGVAATFHDITRLTQLEQVRREFVANVSHELRTPLSIFQGHIEMLLEYGQPSPETIQSSLLVLQRHSQRLNALVEDLLTLARLESRHGELDLAPLESRTFLQRIADDLQFKFAEALITLRCDVGEDVPCIEADAFRLEQVLHNLLENARKYTPADGTVTLMARAMPEAQGVEWRVVDTGTGIPANDLPHIFERFYRADKARSRSLGGTGLGLAIVKHIIHLHGGTVRAESIYGRGTSIILALPLQPPQPEIDDHADHDHHAIPA